MDDLFNQNSESGAAPVVIDETKNYLEEYVGEGKKFKTVEDLAKGKKYSDDYIEKLKNEISELRAQRVREETEEQFYDRVKALVTGNPSGKPQDPPKVEQDPAKPNGLTLEDVERLLQEREQRRQAETVYETSSRLLIEKMGSKEAAQQAIVKKAQEFGISPKELQAIAQKNTAMFMAYFGGAPQPTQKAPVSAPPANTRPVVDQRPSAPGKTYSWFKNQERANPKLGADTKFQAELNKALTDAINEGRYEEFLNS